MSYISKYSSTFNNSAFICPPEAEFNIRGKFSLNFLGHLKNQILRHKGVNNNYCFKAGGNMFI